MTDRYDILYMKRQDDLVPKNQTEKKKKRQIFTIRKKNKKRLGCPNGINYLINSNL